LVWSNPFEALRSENTWRGIGDFRVLAGVLAAVMLALYAAFA
jgi:hypothetical protein